IHDGQRQTQGKYKDHYVGKESSRRHRFLRLVVAERRQTLLHYLPWSSEMGVARVRFPPPGQRASLPTTATAAAGLGFFGPCSTAADSVGGEFVSPALISLLLRVLDLLGRDPLLAVFLGDRADHGPLLARPAADLLVVVLLVPLVLEVVGDLL